MMMKSIISFLCMVASFHLAFAQQVGINTTTPHTSAVVEVRSLQKGLLIPRMLKADRESISNPPEGLLVFQTDGQAGFYYYQSSLVGWKIIGIASSLSDADNDTKIHVEKNPDEDMVRGELAGVEYWNIQKNAANKSRLEILSNQNIGIGDSTIMSITSGRRNVAFGNAVLPLNTGGNDNIGIGHKALYTSRSNYNIAIGQETMTTDSIYLPGGIAIGSQSARMAFPDGGNYGINIGSLAASANMGGGDFQIAIGSNALHKCNTTWKNIGIGAQALYNTFTPSESFPDPGRNIAIGFKVMYDNVRGSTNIAMGSEAGNRGTQNISIGYKALSADTVINEIGVGSHSLEKIIAGADNIGLGYNAGTNLLSGQYNSVMGSNALFQNEGNDRNTVFGSNALNLGTGHNNSAAGYNAMSSANAITQSVAIGANAMSNTAGANQNIAIGYNANIAPGVMDGIAIGANAYAGTDNCIVLGSVAGINGATTSTQVGIGTNAPHESAILEVVSDEYGFGLPSAIPTSINDPAEGLMLWDQTVNSPLIYNGMEWDTLYTGEIDLIGEAGKTLVYRNNSWQNGFLHKLKIKNLPFRATVEQNPDDDAFRIYAKNGFESAQEKFTMMENVNGQLMMEFPNNNKNISLGQDYIKTGLRNISLGQITYLNYGIDNIAIGNFLCKDNSVDTNTISIGYNNIEDKNVSKDNIAIGGHALNYSTWNNDQENIAIGFFTNYDGIESVNGNIQIGNNIEMESSVVDATAIGHNTFLSQSNTVILGQVPGRGLGQLYMDVGIGTTNPDRPLHIKGISSSTNPHILIESEGTATSNLKLKYTDLNKQWNIFGRPDPNPDIARLELDFNFTGNFFSLRGNGDLYIAGTLSDNSDSTLKKDILPLETVLDKLNSIHAYQYRWKDDKKDKGQQIGVIAQDIEKVFPQLVVTSEDDMKSVNYPALNAVLVKALQELIERSEVNAKKLDENTQRLMALKKEKLKKKAQEAGAVDVSITSTQK